MAANSGEKSSFSIACGLLSQYIKEKNNIVNLNLVKNDSCRRPVTMSLLPGAQVESEIEEEYQNGIVFCSVSSLNEIELFPKSSDIEAFKEKEKDAAKDAELKIIYGGKVLVFDNFPQEKAKDLMKFARKENSQAQDQKPTKPIFSDLPIMRKNSLQRFLEKRKDRLNSKAPYQKINGALIKKENGESDSWLSLNLSL